MSTLLPRADSLSEDAQRALNVVAFSRDTAAFNTLLVEILGHLLREGSEIDLDERPHYLSRNQGATQAVNELNRMIKDAATRR